MSELSHEEALKHVLHDEVLERLDKIIALLEQREIKPESRNGFIAAWRVAERFRLSRRIGEQLQHILKTNQQYLDE